MGSMQQHMTSFMRIALAAIAKGDSDRDLQRVELLEHLRSPLMWEDAPESTSHADAPVVPGTLAVIQVARGRVPELGASAPTLASMARGAADGRRGGAAAGGGVTAGFAFRQRAQSNLRCP